MKEEKAVAAVPQRKRLPDERASITQRFIIHGEQGEVRLYVTVGLYPDGQVGEIFVRIGKEGGMLQTVMDQWATAVSVGLQYGIPLEVFVEKAEFVQCEPMGMVRGAELVRMCKGPMDCVARWLRGRFLAQPSAGPT